MALGWVELKQEPLRLKALPAALRLVSQSCLCLGKALICLQLSLLTCCSCCWCSSFILPELPISPFLRGHVQLIWSPRKETKPSPPDFGLPLIPTWLKVETYISFKENPFPATRYHVGPWPQQNNHEIIWHMVDFPKSGFCQLSPGSSFLTMWHLLS